MINKMKQKNIFFLFILYCLSKNSNQQQIIIPLEPGLDVEHNENNNNDNDQEVDQPIVITKEITRNDGQHIKITKIHFHKTKNLNGDSDAITPFQIIRIFDNRVNSIFEDIIRQTLGFRSFFNMVENSDDDDDTEDTRQKKINKRRNKKYNKKDVVDDIFDEIEKQFDLIEKNENKTNYKEENTNKENNESDNKKNVVSKETKSKKGNKSNEKSKVNLDVTKSAKKKKKLSRKQLIFSRVCKYIFYMIILFGFYWLIKKFLEFLEIIDPDGVTEAKIQDEETTNLKKIENK